MSAVTLSVEEASLEQLERSFSPPQCKGEHNLYSEHEDVLITRDQKTNIHIPFAGKKRNAHRQEGRAGKTSVLGKKMTTVMSQCYLPVSLTINPPH